MGWALRAVHVGKQSVVDTLADHRDQFFVHGVDDTGLAYERGR